MTRRESVYKDAVLMAGLFGQEPERKKTIRSGMRMSEEKRYERA